ncbi:hypothetical protein JD844_006185 [Phrynosoma platyrhinos]|uniref:C-type lectin domain-containing protein n=1 Tax=Phrynosoma platyrhinos TaxID=52577 RepID=A0ABQ7T1H1_PHRPL|nr:hypothetical protein JD844_006185 [Phrynosoma platyrhinos]
MIELPRIQALWGPGPKGEQGSRGDNKLPELEFLQTQIKDLQAQLDIFKAAVTKTQEEPERLWLTSCDCIQQRPLNLLTGNLPLSLKSKILPISSLHVALYSVNKAYDLKALQFCFLLVLLAPNGVIVGEKIFKTDGSKGDYDAAQANCVHMGGTLAVPRDAAENRALQKIVAWHNRRAILGINDMATEGTFKDLNGQVIQYSNWAPGEPNNVGNEDCAEVHPDGKWHDRGCTLEWLVICEF